MDTQVKPGTPFRKALLMHGILTQLAARFKGLALQQAVGALGAYEGRGKKQPNGSGRARRVRQIEKGMLKCTA